MSWLKGFLSFFIQNKENIKDMKEVTSFLKDNNAFRKTAFYIHDTKLNIKDKFKNSFEKLLQEEDNLKFIEDEKSKMNKDNKDNKK